tara:strand:- start:61179 stop:61958 length:780 start_codon:yes stop_codon:yes gene_type:complete
VSYYYRVRIAYKGTNFHGWQAQTADVSDEALPSVQGTIHRVLRKISRYQDCTISGTSRTDAGVHAAGQVGKITLPTDIEPATLLRGLNSMLPESIRILACSRCAPEFNAKVGATSKEYHYYFSQDPVLNPLIADVVAPVPGPLDLARLQETAQLFVGTHDFYSFCRRSSNAATTVRTVFSCGLVAVTNEHLMAGVCILRVVGDGFLKQMIRYMASTLFAVARGSLSATDVAAHIGAQQETKLCAKAPARGLHLVSIQGL